MRDTIGALDSKLQYILVFNIINTIYTIMLDIYTLSLLDQVPGIKSFAQLIAFSTLSAILELVVTCFMCGHCYDESCNIYNCLDGMNARELTDPEYKEWMMFKQISRKHKKFCFTIGGFVCYRKTTLISVSISKLAENLFNNDLL